MIDDKKTQVTLPSATEILITRTFAAPRELVWQMWTETQHLQHWFGPEGWALPISEMDFRVGGSWFYCMEGPDGMKSCGRSTYLTIDYPENIVYEDVFVDAAGKVFAQMPVAHVTLTFKEAAGRTKVINNVRYPTKAARDKVIEMGMEAGIDQTLNRLEAYLAQVTS